jgi:hypothetical protein
LGDSIPLHRAARNLDRAAGAHLTDLRRLRSVDFERERTAGLLETLRNIEDRRVD